MYYNEAHHFHSQTPPQIHSLSSSCAGILFNAENYTHLNISAEANSLFLRFPLFFYFQRAVVKFSAHSAENCSAQEIKLQCAVEKKTVR